MSGNSPARKCVVQGVTCDSQLEGKRWFELLMLEKTGEIRDLVPHPVFQLVVFRETPPALDRTLRGEATLVCKYVADAEYVRILPDGSRLHVVEDTKGRRAGSDWKIFRLKAKLFRALHGFDVEVYPPAVKKPRKRKL